MTQKNLLKILMSVCLLSLLWSNVQAQIEKYTEKYINERLDEAEKLNGTGLNIVSSMCVKKSRDIYEKILIQKDVKLSNLTKAFLQEKIGDRELQLAKSDGWDSDKVEQTYKEAILRYKSSSLNRKKRNEKIAFIYYKMGLIPYLDSEDFKRLKERQTQQESRLLTALDMYRKLNNLEMEGKVLESLGQHHYEIRNYKMALEYDKQALNIYEKLNNVDKKSKVLSNISWSILKLDKESNKEEALNYAEKSLRISKMANDSTTEGIALVNIAGLWRDLGNMEKAKSYYEEALSVYKKVEDIESQGTVYFALSKLYHDVGDNEKAKLHKEKYNEIIKQKFNCID